jgi:hypothetical protein
MSKQAWMPSVLVLGALAAAVPSYALDPWEIGAGDDSRLSIVTLGPGARQVHDLDQGGTSVNDEDWIVVPTLDRHSYEVRLADSQVVFDWGLCPTCAQFERVNGAGTVLTEDLSTVYVGYPQSYERSIRWIAPGNSYWDYVRVKGRPDVVEDAGSTYTVRFWDTTYVLARWNASGGQSTVVMIANLVQANVSGRILFFDASGALVHTQPFSLSQFQQLVFNTSSVPALAGLAGHAYVAHTAGYGGLSGKAVTLDPSLGFSFDVALEPIAQ